MKLSILYLGDDKPHTTSMHRAGALQRLGHDVQVVNPEPPAARVRLAASFHFRTGYRFTRRAARGRVLRATSTENRFDLVWVDGGRAVDARLVRQLKQRVGLVVNYNNDDPFGPENTKQWRTFVTAAPEYDLLAVVRDENVTEAYERGVRRVLRVWRSYDDVAHRPRTLTPEDVERWQSDVLFVGSWMPERGPFFLELLERDIPLQIYGPRWHKAKEWPALKSAWQGGYLGGDDYAKAIQCSAVTLGLLAKTNRDLHTQRSFEVPALGGVLCAERTTEHQFLYREDEEAMFWSDVDECAEKCRVLLRDDARRAKVAAAGRAKVLGLQASNEKVVAQVLDVALASG